MTRKERRRLIRQAKLEAKLRRIESGERLWPDRARIVLEILGNPLIRGLLASKIKELR